MWHLRAGWAAAERIIACRCCTRTFVALLRRRDDEARKRGITCVNFPKPGTDETKWVRQTEPPKPVKQEKPSTTDANNKKRKFGESSRAVLRVPSPSSRSSSACLRAEMTAQCLRGAVGLGNNICASAVASPCRCPSRSFDDAAVLPRGGSGGRRGLVCRGRAVERDDVRQGFESLHSSCFFRIDSLLFWQLLGSRITPSARLSRSQLGPFPTAKNAAKAWYALGTAAAASCPRLLLPSGGMPSARVWKASHRVHETLPPTSCRDDKAREFGWTEVNFPRPGTHETKGEWVSPLSSHRRRASPSLHPSLQRPGLFLTDSLTSLRPRLRSALRGPCPGRPAEDLSRHNAGGGRR